MNQNNPMLKQQNQDSSKTILNTSPPTPNFEEINKKEGKNSFKIFIIFGCFVLVFILGILSHWLFQNYFSKPVMENTPPQASVNENYIQAPNDSLENYWEKFTNKEYKISFMHPITFYQEKEQLQNGLQLVSLNNETLTILINTNKEKDSCQRIIQQEQIFINDLPAVKEVVENSSCDNPEQISIWLSTRYKNNKYQVIFTYSNKTKVTSQRTFLQILSTFEFMN